MTTSQQYMQVFFFLKNGPLTCSWGSFCDLENAHGFVNVKLVIVELWVEREVQHLQSKLITV